VTTTVSIRPELGQRLEGLGHIREDQRNVDDDDDARAVAAVEAWFRRRGLRLSIESERSEWFATVTIDTGEPLYVTGRGRTRLEAAQDAQAFLE
jgi:hypothetical protein